MMPTWKFSDLIVVHAQLGFGFLKALLDSPSQPAEPNERFQPCAGRCIANEKAVFRIIPQSSPD